MYNLLTEPLIRYKTDSGELPTATLPQIYAALVADDVASFSALRPHQRHAWHAFLVQLGAMALHRAGKDGSDLPTDAGEWAAMIRGLTPDWPEDEPWQLVVDDITKPAFMQPPASSTGREADFKANVSTPDELDMLVASKNHDLKASVAITNHSDDWLFSLIGLQTMEGYAGAGNHGISRMNGGLGNRPAFTLTPSNKVGGHVKRDIATLLQRRSSLLNGHAMVNQGINLLWTVGWDGTESFPLNKLDPLFIEVCRRVRLVSRIDGSLFGIRASSKATRVEAKAMNGCMGDPWTPIDLKGNKSLTLSAGGFTYRRVTEYLDRSSWALPILFAPTGQEEHYLVARAMVRGQGKTEGYHERFIPLRRGVVRMDSNRGLDVISKERVVEVGKVQRILSHAIQVFLARGDAAKVNRDQLRLVHQWCNRLDKAIDANFFEDLQDEVEVEQSQGNGSTVRHDWLQEIVFPLARHVLYEAEDSLPCPSIYRYRARVEADGLFEGRLRTEFSDHFRNQGDPE